jgi:hypothetical protein
MVKRETDEARPSHWPRALWMILPMLAFVAFIMVLSIGANASPGDSTNIGESDVGLVTPTITMTYQKTGADTYLFTVVGVTQNDVKATDITVSVMPSTGLTVEPRFSVDVQAGDVIYVNSTTASTEYTMTLVYDPTGEVAYQVTWTTTGPTPIITMIQTPFVETVIDANGIPGYEELRFTVGIDIASEGSYTADGTLLDSNSDILGDQVVFFDYLYPGSYQYDVVFGGSLMNNHGIDGPYVFRVTLYGYADTFSQIDLKEQTTNVYAFTEFEWTTGFMGLATITADDSDENGLINNLIVSISIETSIPGYYSFSCEFHNKTGIGGYGIYDGGYIDGVLSYSFIFQGLDISKWMPVEGEGITVVLTLKDSNRFLADRQDFLTEAYQFEYFFIQDDYVISTPDLNANGFYDSLDMSFQVETSLTGYCNVNAFLYDDYNNQIGNSQSYYYFTPGTNEMAVSFSGQLIYSSGIDGPYVVNLLIYDEPYVVGELDRKTFTTDTYAASSFDHSSFVPPYTESVLDTDADGLYEYIIVDVSINIIQEGGFTVQGLLTNSEGAYVGNSVSSMGLAPGTYNIELWYDTFYLKYAGLDGPYYLDLTLDDTFAILASDTYVTDDYSISQFEGPATLAPPHSDMGIDTDGNGYFERIEVTVNFEVTCAGWYSIYGDVVDGEGNIITSGYGYGEFRTGPQSLTLLFNTLFLYGKEMAGPYDVRLTIQDPFGGVADIGMYQTTAYTLNQFDHVSILPSITDHGVDTDGNGLYEHISIEIVIDSTQTGTCNLEATLKYYYPDGSGWFGFSQYYTIELVPGPNPFEMQFMTMWIGNGGFDGPYQIELYLMSALGSEYNDYWTAPYDSVQFDHVYVVPPLSDHGVDTNGNGLFEYLSIDMTIDSSFTGWYDLWLVLWDINGNNFYYASQSFNLSPGQQTVNMLILGNIIINNNAYGPYSLVCVSGTDSYWSSTINAYGPQDFEKIASLVLPSLVFGSDQDLDGLYEDLVIQETIEVHVAGWYHVDGYLYGQWGQLQDRKDIFLEPGQYQVCLKFSGARLLRNGIEGPYQIVVNLHDVDWNVLDSDYPWVSEYTLDQFEPLAKFISPHKEKGLDIDGDGKFEYIKVMATVDISVPGEYSLWTYLRDSNGELLETSYTWVTLKAKVQTIVVLIPANNMVSTGTDGPYTIWMSLADSSLYYNYGIAFDNFQTREYRSTQFDPGTILTDVNSDIAVDMDGDGLYDVLEVDVQVYVDKAGTFTLSGELYCNDFHTLLSIDKVTERLSHGMNTVTLSFSGTDIWSKGLNGPYQIELRLFSFDGQLLDEDDHVPTAEYQANSFDPPTFNASIKGNEPINLRSSAILEVVIYGSKQVDVSKIDIRTLKMGHDGLWITVWKWEYVDVNNDGMMDLVLVFNKQDVTTVVAVGMTSIDLKFLYDSQNVEVTCKIVVKIPRTWR